MNLQHKKYFLPFLFHFNVYDTKIKRRAPGGEIMWEGHDFEAGTGGTPLLQRTNTGNVGSAVALMVGRDVEPKESLQSFRLSDQQHFLCLNIISCHNPVIIYSACNATGIPNYFIFTRLFLLIYK